MEELKLTKEQRLKEIPRSSKAPDSTFRTLSDHVGITFCGATNQGGTVEIVGFEAPPGVLTLPLQSVRGMEVLRLLCPKQALVLNSIGLQQRSISRL